MRSSRPLVALLLVAAAIASAAWLVSSVGELHARVSAQSRPMAMALVVAASATAIACSLAAARFLWALGRDHRPSARAPDTVALAAEEQTRQAEAVIDLLKDESARVDLGRELAAIKADRAAKRFHVVVFGTGSAGKSSLINALIGEVVAATGAAMGTTRRGEVHDHLLESVDGDLLLTDTPGLSEVGSGGADREAEARELAARADLLLFVVDHDLIRSEYDPLIALARQGKRSIVVLNKKDRLLDPDRLAILAKLRERLAGVVPADSIVAVSASPRPTSVRTRNPDGSTTTSFEVEPPDLADLEARVAAVLRAEGDDLRAGNLLLRAHLLGRAAQDHLTRERRAKAKQVVDKFQWMTAATVFTNPIPALDLMATGAVQFQMITEIAAAYGVSLSTNHIKMVGGQMVQMLLKLGLVEASTSLVAGLFKSSIVGYAAGGAVQAVTMAYLTHISGLTFTEFFERGQSWGDGGMQAALVRQFDLNSRADFLQEFAGQAVERVVKKFVGNESIKT